MQTEKCTLEIISAKLPQWEKILKQLSAIPAFEGIAEKEIQEILLTGEIVFIESNEYLMRQNDTDNNLYVLLQGYLQVIQSQDEQENIVAEISPIDVVGEIAFFTTNPRNANVISIRDSVLIQLSREKILKHPSFIQFITNVAKISTERLVSKRSVYSFYQCKIKSITLVPAGDFKEIEKFAEKFHASLKNYGTVFLRNKHNTSQITSKEQYTIAFHENELQCDYLLNIIDHEVSEFSTWCINQTDHLIFAADENTHRDLNAVEKFIAKEKKHVHRKEFVLIRKSHETSRDFMQKFISERQINGYYNTVDENDAYGRLVRCVIGKNTCLVLSGGGARGLAHIGTIRALIEKKIPIDMIGGTSMGSLVAAAYARFPNYGKFYEAIEKFCFGYKFNKYTLPFVSVFTGQDFTGGFKIVCGEKTYIEDLHCRYFCVACNLSYPRLEVFKTGLLWNAVRASFSIPAVLPPIINEKGEILVDGCVMNNLPVDQMRIFSNGGKVIASQIMQTGSIHRYDSSDGIVRGSRLLLNKLNPFAKKINLPHINFLFMKSLLISSQRHQLQMAREADLCVDHDIKRVGLFEFKSLEKIVDIGYQNTLSQLEEGKISN